MGILVFMVEEPSMQLFLDHYIPRRFPSLQFQCISHRGKNDLEKSIPRKLRAWHGAHFVILRDNDGSDCIALKRKLSSICNDAGRPDSKIRIVCQALEAWYLGVPELVAELYRNNRFPDLMRRRKLQDPDLIPNPDQFLSRHVPEFKKHDGARRFGLAMPLDIECNHSKSFRVFMKTVELFAEQQNTE